MMNEVNLPLVSVGVYTYNSSKTVIETLESIKSQTYPNLELIVSDDCSTDNTVSLCQDWLEHNKDRFVDTKIIVPDKNTGQSGNYNRALKASNGEWIKDIDGDDLLTPNCIKDYVNFIQEHPEAIFVFGRTEVFGNSKEKIDFFNKFFDYSFFKLSVEEKYVRLVTKGNCIVSPSAFSNVKKRKDLGLYYDERIPMLEDLPMWVRATKQGLDLYYIDKVVCKYRVGGNGVTSGRGHINFMKSQRLYELYYVLPYYFDQDYERGMQFVHSYEMSLYDQISSLELAIRNILQSRSYVVGNTLLTPLKWIRNLFIKK